MQKIKQFLEHWPFLYHIIRRIYVLVGSPIGGLLVERRWATADISSGYYANINHPSKQFIIDQIKTHVPVCSILEVGCSSGPNITLLAQQLPSAQVVGVDINRKAVEYGNEQLHRQGISNAHLITGKADRLERFPDDSFDIVFTVGVLTHIPPKKIKGVLQELHRVASQWLILVEPLLRDSQATTLSVYYNGQWLRDYIKLLKELRLANEIRVTKIPPHLWPGKPWGELGAIVEANLEAITQKE